MTAPYMGGFRFTGAWWEDIFTLRVEFETTYETAYKYQLYVNRSLAGTTDSTADREILCYCFPSEWPQELTLLAVDPAEVNTDYGAQLPIRPYNQVRLTIQIVDWTDGRFIEITSSTEPGGAVDPTNVLSRVLYDEDRDYLFLTDPLPGSGAWPFEIAGRDETLPSGNRGPAATVSVDIYAHPPDVRLNEDGTRFTASVAAGNLTVNFEEAI